MDYNRLLNGFTSLPILVNKYPYYLVNDSNKYQGEISKLNNDLYLLLDSFCNNNYKKIIKIIKITLEGLYFDLSILKNTMSEYFGFKIDNNLISNLDKLENDIKNFKFTYKDMTALMKEYHLYYHSNYYMFMKKVLKDIYFFKDLYLNEEKYSKVNDIFDQDRVNLYLAYFVKAYGEKLLKDGNYNDYLFALRYLSDYINNNQDLVNSNYTLDWKNYDYNNRPIILPYEKRIMKNPYKITNIELYVKQNTKNKSSDELNIDKYNYSFFECDGLVGRNLIKKYLNNIKNNNTSDIHILLRKIGLYEELDYKKIKVGIDSFDGYIGFVFDNGMVILDKLFDNTKDNKIATDNAIYIVMENDFENITKMSKSQAIDAINNGEIHAKRLFHSGDYESRVKKYIK